MSNTGRTCKVHYTGTFNDGTKFDSSYDRGEPIEFVCGAGQMIPGFDQAVEGMNVGDIIDVHLRPEDAYGMPDPEAIIKAPLADMPGAENLEVGNQVYLANSMGQQFLVKVIEKDDESITFDANHEMAGKELNFKIKLVSVDWSACGYSFYIWYISIFSTLHKIRRDSGGHEYIHRRIRINQQVSYKRPVFCCVYDTCS